MIKKTALPGGKKFKVTFEMSEAEAASVALVGEFNDWNKDVTPLRKRKKDGVFAASINLAAGRKYEFRYLVDAARWENDGQADAYVPNGFGSDNSVVRT